jgi:hypothetical protein
MHRLLLLLLPLPLLSLPADLLHPQQSCLTILLLLLLLHLLPPLELDPCKYYSSVSILPHPISPMFQTPALEYRTAPQMALYSMQWRWSCEDMHSHERRHTLLKFREIRLLFKSEWVRVMMAMYVYVMTSRIVFIMM